MSSALQLCPENVEFERSLKMMVACLQIGGLFKVGRGNPGRGRGAKVHQHRRVVLGQQHIVRFDVPVLEF